MTVEAIIYARFSKLEQGKGNSIERQLSDAHAFCAARQWATSEALEYIEEGKSAFTGANRAAGTLLYQLEEEIVAGLHVGRYLVVEAFDRISRQGYEEVLDFVRAITGAGVGVATVSGGRIYEPYARVAMAEIMEIVLKSELAREESANKSKRVKAAFAKKRKAAADGEISTMHGARLPQWLKFNEDKSGFEEIDDRVKAVRLIFDLREGNLGTYGIAKTLNGQNFATFRGMPGGWAEHVIARILRNRAVIGEYTSHKYGTRILNYYPQIISVDQFNRAQAVKGETVRSSKGRRGNDQSNLFGGIVKCAECGGPMYLSTSRRAGYVSGVIRQGRLSPISVTTNASYMHCDTRRMLLKDENGQPRCTNKKTVRYEYVEPVILDQVLSLALDEDSFKAPDTAKARIALAESERVLKFKEEEAATLALNLKGKISPTITALVIQMDEEIAELRVERDKLVSKLASAQGATPTAEMLDRIKSTQNAMKSEDFDVRRRARIKVHHALTNIITSIQCDSRGHSVVALAHGLVAFELDAKGRMVQLYDHTGNTAVIRSLTSGSLAANTSNVSNVIARAKKARRATA